MIRQWVAAWKEAGPELERLRQEDVRNADPRESIQILASAFNYATRSQPPRESSGMVEMQRIFAKLRP